MLAFPSDGGGSRPTRENCAACGQDHGPTTFPLRFLEINSEKQLVLRKAEVAARKGANFAAKRGPGHRPEGDKMLIETAKELREVAGQHPLDVVALAKATTRRQLRKYQRQVEVGGCLAGSVAAWLPSERSPAIRPSSSAGHVGGWTQPIRAGAIGRQHGPHVAVSSVGQLNAAQAVTLSLNWGNSRVRQDHWRGYEPRTIH